MHGDDEPYGSVQRVELFDKFPLRPRLPDVVGIMNRAATEDVRSPVWPVVSRVLKTGPAPNARDQKLADLLDDWVRRDAPRLDADNDGLYDEAAPAIMDGVWVPIVRAVMTPRFGPLLDDLNSVRSLNSLSGESYVDKDLRTLLGDPVRGRFNLRYCGRGSLVRCRAWLWNTIDAAANDLAAQFNSQDPTKWIKTASRTGFTPGLIPQTMRTTNRPTFQQVLRFAATRPPGLGG